MAQHFLLSHKIRAALIDNLDDTKFDGTVEMEGCYTRSYIRPENKKKIDLIED